LVEIEAPTLLFVPTVLGQMPELGSTCSWSGGTFVVSDVLPLAPDGIPILGRIIISGGLGVDQVSGGVYLKQHASAYTSISKKGSPVSFSSVDGGSTVAGVALETKGDPRKYEALNLVQSMAPTLLFVPITYGECTQAGWICTWKGVDYAVKDISPLAPDGRTILAKVIIKR
jgi:hypothetical protein